LSIDNDQSVRIFGTSDYGFDLLNILDLIRLNFDCHMSLRDFLFSKCVSRSRICSSTKAAPVLAWLCFAGVHSRFCCESVANSAESSICYGQRVREWKPISTFRQLRVISTEICGNQRVNGRLANWPLCKNRAELRSSSVRICPKSAWLSRVRVGMWR